MTVTKWSIPNQIVVCREPRRRSQFLAGPGTGSTELRRAAIANGITRARAARQKSRGGGGAAFCLPRGPEAVDLWPPDRPQPFAWRGTQAAVARPLFIVSIVFRDATRAKHLILTKFKAYMTNL